MNLEQSRKEEPGMGGTRFGKRGLSSKKNKRVVFVLITTFLVIVSLFLIFG